MTSTGALDTTMSPKLALKQSFPQHSKNPLNISNFLRAVLIEYRPFFVVRHSGYADGTHRERSSFAPLPQRYKFESSQYPHAQAALG